MKKYLFVVIILISGVTFAQGTIGLFAGVGQSAFDETFYGEGNTFDQASYIPVGVQLLFGDGMFMFGGEVNYAAVPITFEMSAADVKFADLKIDQLYFGGVAKLRLGGSSGIIPYGRIGAGIYTGKIKVEWVEELINAGYENAEADFKSAFGFNVGAGLEINLSSNNGIFAEIIYHKVKRQIDADGEEAFNADNVALHVGFQFSLD